VIRCFKTEAALDADIDALDGSVDASVAYVRFHQDENYGGGSFTAYDPMPSMSDYGWNDQITSCKSLNNGRSRWYQDADFTGGSWRWPAGALDPNMGSGANDAFSSVANDP
jgi:hypothetical protein